jgi:hypothetical protein
MAEKKKLAAKYAPRYRKACKAEKTRILNDYLSLTEENRKYAIFKLNHVGKTQLRVLIKVLQSGLLPLNNALKGREKTLRANKFF